MTAVLADRAPTAAEREQQPLVAEIAYVRGVLHAYGDGSPPPQPPLHASEFAPAIDSLTRLLGLSTFERHVLLFAAAVELDGDVAALVSALQNGADPRPTFGLALAALPQPHWDALAPLGPLRRWSLIELTPGPTLASRPLRIDERILHFLTGIDALDERLDGVVHAGRSVPLAASQLRIAEELAATVVTTHAPAVVKIDGEDRDARFGVAQAVAATLARDSLVVRAAALPSQGPELVAVARLISRESLLRGAVPIVEVDEADVDVFLDELHAPLAVVVGDSDVRATLHRSVGLPAPAEARRLWAAALHDETLAGTIEELAQHFRLGAAAIDAVVREQTATGGDAASLRRLCRERARVRLDGLAQRIDPEATWDDLVLPPGHLDLLREITRHVRYRTQVYERWAFGARTSRGLGVTALFSGESGTGKTLAAEVLAAELGLDLYRIDLAATVSKYIGETEKNLRTLFEAAEASGAVLLFDEADALFGKRGEVRDGHDRYANLEIAYLLQRMESYRGLAILTTNLRANVDRAFLRRLRFVVQFPFPDVPQRAEIWRRELRSEAPLDGVDPERIAALNAPGGSIRSIALSAAFAAAEAGTAIKPEHLLHAARIEYAKAERSLTDSEAEALR